jgi:hypothetical protein
MILIEKLRCLMNMICFCLNDIQFRLTVEEIASIYETERTVKSLLVT